MKAASPAVAAAPADAEPVAQEAAPAAPESVAAPESANGNAFNPAISIILNGSYSDHSLDPDVLPRSGFPLVGEGGSVARRAFRWAKAKSRFAANIDEKFYGQLTLAIGEDGGNTELGSRGSLHRHHCPARRLHACAPAGSIPTSAISTATTRTPTSSSTGRSPTRPSSANQYGDDGVQLRWVAPTDLFLRARRRTVPRRELPRGGAAIGGAGVGTLFAHAGGDVGVENLLAGRLVDAQVEHATAPRTDSPATARSTSPTPPGNGRPKETSRMAA